MPCNVYYNIESAPKNIVHSCGRSDLNGSECIWFLGGINATQHDWEFQIWAWPKILCAMHFSTVISQSDSLSQTTSYTPLCPLSLGFCVHMQGPPQWVLSQPNQWRAEVTYETYGPHATVYCLSWRRSEQIRFHVTNFANQNCSNYNTHWIMSDVNIFKVTLNLEQGVPLSSQWKTDAFIWL